MPDILKNIYDRKVRNKKMASEALALFRSYEHMLPQIFEFCRRWFCVEKLVISDGTLEERESKDIVLTKEADRWITNDSGKLLIVTLREDDDTEEKCALKKRGYTTFSELLFLRDRIERDLGNLPRIFNTIENSYSFFYLYGETFASEKLFKYLSENKNITVCRITDEELKRGDYYADHAQSVLIICDLLPEGMTARVDIPVVHWEKIISAEEIMDSRSDILKNIVPELQKNGVQCVMVSTPWISSIAYRFDLIAEMLKFKRLLKGGSAEYIKVLYKHFGTEELIDEHMDIKTARDEGFARMFHNGERVNYDNGFRRTMGGSASYKRRVWMFGSCIVLGMYVDDANTIPSLLQKMLGPDYLVINRGQPHSFDMNLLMRNEDFRQGDIVLFFGTELKKEGYPYIDLWKTYKKIPRLGKHLGDSILHCDAVVNRYIADDIYEFIKNRIPQTPVSEKIFRFGSYIKRPPLEEMLKNPEFGDYLRDISVFRKEGKNGAIVMNCNPLTNGHMYLINEAAGRVDNLYIFVVEEDKSFFKFEDRFALVKEGTKEIKNVTVLKSGKFVISSTTLPGYFEKDQVGDIYLDASGDLAFFLQIAEKLGISVRFAGHEPTDKFTAQYNQNMKTYLEKYGMEFCEIERKKEQDTYISASTVRKLLKEKRFEEIKKLVPECTYRYLAEKYKEC